MATTPTQSLKDSRWAPSSSFSRRSNKYNSSSFNTRRLCRDTDSISSNTTNHSLSAQHLLNIGTDSPIQPRSTSPSKWASSAHRQWQSQTPAPGIADNDRVTPYQRSVFRRQNSSNAYHRLIKRFRWKATTLLMSYNRTLELIHQNNLSRNGISAYDNQSQRIYTTSLDPVTLPSISQDEPETMFKIDFFEFYVLLERTIVALLGIFGIEVSGIHAVNLNAIEGDGARQHQQLSEPSLNGGRATFAGIQNSNQAELQSEIPGGLIGNSKVILKSQNFYTHSYHANVLSALDSASCPLHHILGTGDVRNYLGIAKAWRNKWKDAEEKEKDEREDGLVGSRYEAMLKELRLESMLGSILIAVDEGEKLADVNLNMFIMQGKGMGVGNETGTVEGVMELDGVTMARNGSTNGPVEAVDDMMDWD